MTVKSTPMFKSLPFYLLSLLLTTVLHSNVTLVSAFLAHVNRRSDRNIENYVEWSQHLLKCNIPKVIFIERSIYDLYYSQELYPQTHFILIERDSLYLNRYRDQITHFNIHTDNPDKDTLDYILMQCNKTEWIQQAIHLNPFNTDQYIWVDFGLCSVFQNAEEFQNSLHSLQTKSYPTIRIGSCWDSDEMPGTLIYSNIAWFFAGGVFGGHKDALIQFNELTMEKCRQIIQEKMTLMWEVNIWYLVYIENKHLFSKYPCDHNSTILNNY